MGLGSNRKPGPGWPGCKPFPKTRSTETAEVAPVRERPALGLSQVELAARADMTQPALSRLEAGGVIPTIPLQERISAALDADLIVEIAPHAA